ncbi:hypothetical protein Q9Q95_10955 [Sphingomonas sp. DG1-23]|jgi:hypothetical protein|uniref:hypothetical protein n=1 Tax=Sphingomonas sp. DG1-23 TaxID=3068316 RepID=UPI00273D4FA5|nr:hypothetical protein [Sphingomonas sp. DG1-23]MDP5279442.1 hypothetical protein [Sphingomonas sp. DG1-23]
MRRLVFAAVAASLIVPGTAQAMTVAQFLAKAKALQAQGALAVLSPDAELIKREVASIRAAYTADLRAARAAGKTPHSCPPATGKPKLTPRQMLAELEKIPPAKRSMSMKAAVYAYMKRTYPCR